MIDDNERRYKFRHRIMIAASLSVLLTFVCRIECAFVNKIHGPMYLVISVCKMINIVFWIYNFCTKWFFVGVLVLK